MFSLQVVFTADAGFLENMKMSSSLPKILETGIHVFKGNSQTIKKLKKPYDQCQLYRNASKNYRWLKVVIFNFFTIGVVWISSVWVVFNNLLLINATDSSNISSDYHRYFFDISIYFLLFFSNTPFISVKF